MAKLWMLCIESNWNKACSFLYEEGDKGQLERKTTYAAAVMLKRKKRPAVSNLHQFEMIKKEEVL